MMETIQAAVDCSLKTITEDLGLSIVRRYPRRAILQQMAADHLWRQSYTRTGVWVARHFGLIYIDQEIRLDKGILSGPETFLIDWRSGESVKLASIYSGAPRAIRQYFSEHPTYCQIPSFVGERALLLRNIVQGLLITEAPPSCFEQLNCTLIGVL